MTAYLLGAVLAIGALAVGYGVMAWRKGRGDG